jgi:hypothetical protein
MIFFLLPDMLAAMNGACRMEQQQQQEVGDVVLLRECCEHEMRFECVVCVRWRGCVQTFGPDENFAM